MAVSLDGSRQSAIHWWPAARVCLSAARPTPALAPKKATVLVLGLIIFVESKLVGEQGWGFVIKSREGVEGGWASLWFLFFSFEAGQA